MLSPVPLVSVEDVNVQPLSVLMPELVAGEPNLSGMSDPWAADLLYLTVEPAPVMGQYFDQDILGDFRDFFTNFVDSGQLWALLIGFVLGYLIRGLTAY